MSDCAVAINLGYSARDLREIVRKIREQRAAFLEAWNDHFANRRLRTRGPSRLNATIVIWP